MNARVKELLDQGQSIWLDTISRGMITSGQLDDMIRNVGIRGVTSNPSIFEKAITGSADYDAQIVELAERGLTDAQIFEELEVEDIRNACDVFRPLYDSSNGTDGFVSIEVAPDLARDTDGTREAVRHLWDRVDRPNLMVKIPGTAEGVPVIHEMLAEGKNINITLLFSIEAYRQVAEAYLKAMERRISEGAPIEHVHSVASFFVSRVDTLVDHKLDEKIAATQDEAAKKSLAALKGKVAVANAKLAYALFEENAKSLRWETVQDAGARPQRPLWASTSTKNPAYSDLLYVDTLIGPHTINTMPEKTIEAFLDHGTVKRTVDMDMDEARQVMADLAAAGISIDEVTDQLENEGIAAFEKAMHSLYASIEGKKASLTTA